MMSAVIRSIRNFAPYLLPAALLATASILLMGLLYYPSRPLTIHAARAPQAVTGDRYWNAYMSYLFEAMLADAVHRLHRDQQTQTHAPYNPHRRGAPSEEWFAGLRAAPLIIENGGDSGRPVLIRL